MSFARKGPWNIARIYELFPWMQERRGQKTAQMSGGEQQSVAIGRALVANPRVLLLRRPRRCPAASSSPSRSAARWSPTPGCCSSTNCLSASRR